MSISYCITDALSFFFPFFFHSLVYDDRKYDAMGSFEKVREGERGQYLRIVVYGKHASIIRETEGGYAAVADVCCLAVENYIGWATGDGHCLAKVD